MAISSPDAKRQKPSQDQVDDEEAHLIALAEEAEEDVGGSAPIVEELMDGEEEEEEGIEGEEMVEGAWIALLLGYSESRGDGVGGTCSSRRLR